MTSQTPRFRLAAAAFVATWVAANALAATLFPVDAPRVERRRPRDVDLVGTSLSMGLVPELRRRLAESAHGLVDHTKVGYQVGDLFAEAMRARASGARRIVVELNAFSFNERVHLGVPRPEQIVTVESENGLLVFGEASWPVRYELLRQGVAEAFLTDRLGAWPGVYASAEPLRVRARRLVRQSVRAVSDEAVPDLIVLDPDELRERTVRNFARKDYESGVDARVLDDLLAWVARERRSARPLDLWLYLPPLNREAIAGLQPGAAAWTALAGWRRQLAARAQSAGAGVLDYTDMFADRPDLFRDYGHPASEMVDRRIADRMAAELVGPRVPERR